MKEKIKDYIDIITGRYEELFLRYSKLYRKENMEERCRKDKDTCMKQYILIAAAALLLISAAVIKENMIMKQLGISSGKVTEITRSDKTENMVELYVCFTDEQGKKHKVPLKISPMEELPAEKPEGKKSESTLIDSDELELKALAKAIEDDPAKYYISLPDKTETGRACSWEYRRDNSWLIILLGAVISFVYTYTMRFGKIRKEENKARESVIYELPQFINKLILLLNGGLVLTDAIRRTVKEREDMGEESYFYSRMEEIYDDAVRTNSPVEIMIGEFARDTQVREFIRVASVISDNVTKGTALTEMLESEGAYLWFARKKKAQEMGRLAETKMTAPLVILLVILIAITITPAMIQM